MKGTKFMKQKRVSVMMIGATMLLALMAGCATTTTSTQAPRAAEAEGIGRAENKETAVGVGVRRTDATRNCRLWS